MTSLDDLLCCLPQPVPRSCLVAISGGVDSAVAVALLKKAGCRVTGLHISMLPRDSCDAEGCCGYEAMRSARDLCRLLYIPFYVANARRQFAEEVVQVYRENLYRGIVGSPCPACNASIKTPMLRRRAVALQLEKVASGHYAGIGCFQGYLVPIRGKDNRKDQSYMLFRLTQDDLASLYLPLANLTKPEVIALAMDLGLPGEGRKESQDLCFVQGKLWQWAGKGEPGDIVDQNGNVLGRHEGLVGVAVGQRRRLGVALGERAYVTRVDTAANRLVLGDRTSTFKSRILINDVNWIATDGTQFPPDIKVELRYRTKPIPCTIQHEHDGIWRLELAEPYQGPSPGQQAVLYTGDAVIGGGTIIDAE